MLGMFFLSNAMFRNTGVYSRSVSLLSNAEIAKKYGLHGEELAAFEYCQDLMPRQGKVRGDLGIYCGCLSKSATDEFFPGYKKYAIQFAAELRRQGNSMTEHGLNYLLPDAAVRGSHASTVRLVQNSMTYCGEQAVNEAARLKAALRAK
jgi:hypothetical protein